MISLWVGASQHWPGDNILNPENQSFENISTVVFK